MIVPGARVALRTGPYVAFLWGDRVRIESFLVDSVEGDVVFCSYSPYAFEWSASELVPVA